MKSRGERRIPRGSQRGRRRTRKRVSDPRRRLIIRWTSNRGPRAVVAETSTASTGRLHVHVHKGWLCARAHANAGKCVKIMHTYIYIYIYMHMRACVGIVSNDDDDEIAAALFNIRAYFPLLESRSELTVLTNQARRCVRARVYRGRRRSVKSSSKRAEDEAAGGNGDAARRLQRSRVYAFVYRAAYGGSMWLVTR